MNKCPSCQKGSLYNSWDKNFNQWIEQCDNCNFSRLHPCRRKAKVNIDFKDRRMTNRLLHDFKRIAQDLSRIKDDVDRLYEDLENESNKGDTDGQNIRVNENQCK